MHNIHIIRLNYNEMINILRIRSLISTEWYSKRLIYYLSKEKTIEHRAVSIVKKFQKKKSCYNSFLYLSPSPFLLLQNHPFFNLFYPSPNLNPPRPLLTLDVLITWCVCVCGLLCHILCARLLSVCHSIVEWKYEMPGCQFLIVCAPYLWVAAPALG